MPLLLNHETSEHVHSPIWCVSLAAATCSGAAGKVEPHWQPHLLQKPPDALTNERKFRLIEDQQYYWRILASVKDDRYKLLLLQQNLVRAG